MRDSSCFFCNIADELMIAEDELCFAMRDDFPVSEGHTLIISKRQVADCFDLTDEEIMAMQTISSILHPVVPSQRSCRSRSRLMSCMTSFFPSAN